MRENKKIIMIGSVAVVALVVVSVAFAALASNLNISFGNVTQIALTWDIGFEGTSVEGVASGTGDVGLSCGTATLTKSTVSISDISLSKPGDRCTYTLTITNNGDIAAKLIQINNATPSNTTCSDVSSGRMVCGNLSYVISDYSTGYSIPIGAAIHFNPGDTANVYLFVNYVGEDVNDTAVTQNGAKFIITFVQAEERSSEDDSPEEEPLD